MSATLSKKTLARTSPAGLAWWASGGNHGEAQWIPAPHLIMLSQKIVDVATGRCPRLIVTMPPRHGKSELISRFAPAWFLGNFPNKKVILASYSDTFAAWWGRRARDVLEEHGEDLFGVRINQESKSGAHWEVDRHEGVMVTAGVGGGITGKGAHFMVIDDPVKNSQDAASETIRDIHGEWWKSTARTRLQKGAGVILVMTRWHEDDLAGRMIADSMKGEGDHWEVLNLPAFCEDESDALGREIDDVLWPEMFDKDWMEQTKKALGTYWFSALYQQRPAPASGLLFKRENFRYYRKMDACNEQGDNIIEIYKDNGPTIFDPAYGTKFCTVDVAASSKQDADYTVVSTWIVTVDRDLILWDRERVQFEGPDLAPFIRRIYFEQRPSLIGIERLGHGLQIIQELVREGLPIIRLEPDTDKVSRALPACARYEEHRIYHPQGPQWVGEEWEHELLVFPNGKNDDQVDTVAYAALQLPMLSAGNQRNRNTGTPRDDVSPRGGRSGTLLGGMMSRQF